MKIGYASGLLIGLSTAATPAPRGVATADQCARNPDMFHMSRLSAPEAEHLFRRVSRARPRLGQLIQGYVVRGECGKYIAKAAPTVRFDLSNGASFVAQVPPYRLVPATPEPYLSSAFRPSPNLLKISAPSRLQGPLNYVDSRDTGSGLRLAIWSGRNGSIIGTVDCPSGGAGGPCTMGHVFLTSPYKIRQLRYLPMPHPDLNGSIALWVTLPGSRQAFVDYSLSGMDSHPASPGH